MIVVGAAMMTSRKLAVLHVAKKQLGLDDDTYRTIIRHYGGAESGSARDLDPIGFEAVMVALRELGFQSESTKRSYGVRPGMASPRQVAFIRRLWSEWSDGGDDAALNRWLERHFHVSALRFLDDRAAHRAISALKAMTKRKADASAASGYPPKTP